MTPSFGIILGVMTLVLAAGCVQTNNDAAGGLRLPIKLLYGSSQCGDFDRPMVTWIAQSEDWQARYRQVLSQYVGLPSPPPVVDFSREGVLLMAMGQRPSAGYGLSLAESFATVHDGMLMMRVDWREPSPGYRQAQVISNPCLLVQLPNASFTRIQVLDRAGQVRLEGVR